MVERDLSRHRRETRRRRQARRRHRFPLRSRSRRYGEPLSIVAPGAPAFARARAWWGGEVTSTADGTSKSPPITGPLIGSVEESLPGAEVTAIGLEYGTIELTGVLDALRGDNWLYARGLKSGLSMDSPLARDIKAKVREALTVDTDEWKQKVYARGADFVLKAFRGLAG